MNLYLDSLEIVLNDGDDTPVVAVVDGHSPVRLVNLLTGVGYEFSQNPAGGDVWQAWVPSGVYKYQLYGSGGFADDPGLTPEISGDFRGVAIGTVLRVYTKRHVLITGTIDSPQTLTCGTSPLAVPDDAGAFPSDFTAASEFAVIVTPEQEQGVWHVEGSSFPDVSAGSPRFRVGASGFGVAHEDGNLYVVVRVLDLR